MTSVRLWLALAALILFARIFQSQVLWPEESLPLAVAQHLLAGRTLYSDVWFDKPPLLAWFYTGVLGVTGSVYGLRLAGALYLLATTWVGYLLARRLWGETAARWTAFFLAFFSGFYIHSAVVPLAADLLLALPHLAALYFLATERVWLAGVCAGVALHVNSKALLVLAAAAGWLLLNGGARKLAPLAAGFAVAAGAGFAAVAATGGWQDYIEQVWRWGSAYAGAAFTEHPWALGLERTLDYAGFHAALVLGAAALFWSRPADRQRRRIALWLAISFAGVIAGGRFFPRYYFQILPPLAVAAGAGWERLSRRRALLGVLLVALAVPAVRVGRVDLWLALGRRFEWRDTAIDADSRRAAREVARWSRASDTIFVWGFRPEIYFYSGRLSASRYLESQPLTGVLADRHLDRSEAFLPQQAAGRRRELARDLAAHPPVVIVDGLGPYNPGLAIEQYPELRDVLARYAVVAQTGGARVYRLLVPGS